MAVSMYKDDWEARDAFADRLAQGLNEFGPREGWKRSERISQGETIIEHSTGVTVVVSGNEPVHHATDIWVKEGPVKIRIRATSRTGILAKRVLTDVVGWPVN